MRSLSRYAGWMAGLLLVLPAWSQTNETAPAMTSTVTNAASMKALLDSAKVKATNLIEWAKKDFERSGTWKYKVVACKGGEGAAANLEAKLNDLGKEGWECFWVREQGEELTFYFKKAERSTISEALKYRP